MSQEDIRWEQRFSNYRKALGKLRETVNYIQNEVENKETPSVLDDIVKQGLIQSFEYTHELAWKVIKDYFTDQGNPNITGSRDATREAFQLGLIADGDAWMDMIKSRNLTSHTYDEDTANHIYQQILKAYFPAFEEFEQVMQEKRRGQS
jgi:nucleotidyltransferase substrate binding protein (TIGR01987 family)